MSQVNSVSAAEAARMICGVLLRTIVFEEVVAAPSLQRTLDGPESKARAAEFCAFAGHACLAAVVAAGEDPDAVARELDDAVGASFVGGGSEAGAAAQRRAEFAAVADAGDAALGAALGAHVGAAEDAEFAVAAGRLHAKLVAVAGETFKEMKEQGTIR